MIDLDWLRDELVAVLRWQLANPGKEDHPDAPDVPFAGRRVWSIFLDLNTQRAGGFGPTPITYSAIESFTRLKIEPIRPFELEIIRALDVAYMAAAAEQMKAGTSPDDTRKVSAYPMTPELFRTMFGR